MENSEKNIGMSIKNSKVYIKNDGNGKGVEVNVGNSASNNKKLLEKIALWATILAIPIMIMLAWAKPSKTVAKEGFMSDEGVDNSKKIASEKVGLNIYSESESDGMEIESTGGGTGAEINISGEAGESVTGVRVVQTGPGTGLKITQTGPGTGMKINVRSE